MAEGRLLFCVIYIRYQDRNDNTKYHQNDGEHFEITHKFALLSKISLCRDCYVIRGFSPSAEGLTAYRSLAVPDLILSEHLFYFNCYFSLQTISVISPFLCSLPLFQLPFLFIQLLQYTLPLCPLFRLITSDHQILFFRNTFLIPFFLPVADFFQFLRCSCICFFHCQRIFISMQSRYSGECSLRFFQFLLFSGNLLIQFPLFFSMKPFPVNILPFFLHPDQNFLDSIDPLLCFLHLLQNVIQPHYFCFLLC